MKVGSRMPVCEKKRSVRDVLPNCHVALGEPRPGRRGKFSGILSFSRAMDQVLEEVEVASRTDVPVLLMGETGTGKELVAQLLHEKSARKARPFVPINTGAIPETLIASVLFGHKKGAFTGAFADQPGAFKMAEGGTLFLDEICAMDPPVQVSLLRVLETKRIAMVGDSAELPVDVRLVAATNKDIAEEVKEGHFREDLYYRFEVFVIRLPALRYRREEIPHLSQAFIHEFTQKYSRPARCLSERALERLLAYSWPGNVRELKHVIQRAVIISRGELIEESHLPDRIAGRFSLSLEVPVGTRISTMERKMISRVLEVYPSDEPSAARALGVSPGYLHRKIVEYGL